MAVNKVEVNGETVVDLTGDTVTPATLARGITAHDASGEQIEGTFPSTIGTDDIADGAVTGQKIADKTITGAQIADKTITGRKLDTATVYDTYVWLERASEFLNVWNRSNVFLAASGVFVRISAAAHASKPDGYRTRIISYVAGYLSWDGLPSDVLIMSLGEHKNYKVTAGKIVIPVGCYMDVQKISSSLWVCSGNYAGGS